MSGKRVLALYTGTLYTGYFARLYTERPMYRNLPYDADRANPTRFKTEDFI